MRLIKIPIAVLFLFGSFILLSSLKEPAKKVTEKSPVFCDITVGGDNQTFSSAILTEVRLSPHPSGTPLLFNPNYASGQSGIFAPDPLGLGNPITIKGRVTGTWSTLSVIRNSDGANLGTYTNTGGGTTFALFGIPNTCDTIMLVVN